MRSRLTENTEDFNAGIGAAEMLGRANYIALVGGGKRPKFPQNKVGKKLAVEASKIYAHS